MTGTFQVTSSMARAVACPTCLAKPTRFCVNPDKQTKPEVTYAHISRKKAYLKERP